MDVASGDVPESGSITGFGTASDVVVSDTAEFDIVVEEVGGVVVLQQAVPLLGSETGLVGILTTEEPETSGELNVFYSSTCSDGSLGEEPDFLGSFSGDEEILFQTDEFGELFFALAIDNNTEGAVTSGFVAASFGSGDPSPCIAISVEDNTSWPRAKVIPASGETFDGFIDGPGVARWYKFAVQPGAQVTVNLGNLPANYDLALFRDIGQAYEEDTADDTDVDDAQSVERRVRAVGVQPERVQSVGVLAERVQPRCLRPQRVQSERVQSVGVLAERVQSVGVLAERVQSERVLARACSARRCSRPVVFSAAQSAPERVQSERVQPRCSAPSVFSPEAFASAQTRSIVAVSANDGTADEVTVANTWNNTGDLLRPGDRPQRRLRRRRQLRR